MEYRLEPPESPFQECWEGRSFHFFFLSFFSKGTKPVPSSSVPPTVPPPTDPSHRPLGHFDRIPPEVLTKLLKPAVSGLSGELLEMVFDDVRLISRPVQVHTLCDTR